jgi:predicted Zn-dependent protease
MDNRKQAILKMLEETPDDEFLNYALSLELEKENNISKSIEILYNIQKINPNYLGLYLKLAQMLVSTNALEAAINILNSGIDIAKSQKNKKAEGELNELLLGLED